MIALNKDEIWSSVHRLLKTSASVGRFGLGFAGPGPGVSDGLGVSFSMASSLGVVDTWSARALDFRFGGIVSCALCGRRCRMIGMEYSCVRVDGTLNRR